MMGRETVPPRPTNRSWTVALCLAALVALVLAIRSSPIEHRTPDQHERDPAFAPLSPASELKTFALADPQLRITLAATEPMVEAPIACSFDEDGRLWVVEMRTYMPDLKGTGELEPDNRIVILEDENNDGVFDKSTTFLDKLVLPRAVAPCYGGALVIEPPNLYFCPDRDKDGKADEKIKLLDGFLGRENPEHAGNGLVYGIDNWWHLSQHHEEFKFDGTRITDRRATPVIGQWGLARDDVGRFYYTPNSDALLCDVFPKHYAARNPNYPNPAGVGENICRDQRVWPAASTPGVNRGYMDGILRADKRLAKLTGACGPVIYRAGALGEEYRGNAFICEVAGNLIKRLILEEKDEIPTARNAYEGREFLTSTDERFRPVNLAVAPDGSLIVCDMYRGVIQHKTYVTPYLTEQIKSRGLERPLNRGRLWRISRRDAPRVAPPSISRQSNTELVALLAETDGWRRDTAQRLLVERRATEVQDLLEEVVRAGGQPPTRIQALSVLDGIDSDLLDRVLLIAVKDADAHVRAEAIRVGGERRVPLWQDHPRTRGMVRFGGADTSRLARVQWWLSIAGRSDWPQTPSVAVGVWRDINDKYIRAAALCRPDLDAADSLDDACRQTPFAEGQAARAFIHDLTHIGLRQSGEQRSAIVRVAAGAPYSPTKVDALAALRSFQRLETDDPRVLALAVEPTEFIRVSREAEDEKITVLMRESLLYMDWPNRPPVSRPKKIRPLDAAQQARFNKGKELFILCSGCHQESGEGGPGLAESLVGSPIVHGPPERLATVLLIGMEGTYKVGEDEFEGAMPAANLANDEEYAAVLTYIRRAWGNTADPVSTDAIAKARDMLKGRIKPWVREDFLKGANP